MLDTLSKATHYLWSFVELGFVALLAIMLIYLVLGQGSGSFVLAVAANVIKFINDIPAGNLAALGIVAALVYWMTRRVSA